MEFINLTPHVVTVYAIDDCTELPGGRGYTIRKCATPRTIFHPSGTVARATQRQEWMPPVERDGVSIPVFNMTYGEPVGLPSDFSADRGYIVSALTANAAKATGRCTSDLFVVQGVVRDNNGAVIGCTGFAKV